MNFDIEINRYNTNSLKYDFKKDKDVPSDVQPMWIADMDFRCSDKILEDMNKKIAHGIFGYSKEDDEYFYSIQNWFKKYHDVELKREWLITTPGVVFALATAVKAITNEGDYVLINNPVYYPYTEVTTDNKRKIISSDLIYENGQYHIDFDDLEKKIKEYKIKLYMFCSPHNPVGRVWTKDELDRIVDICKRNNVYLISDEIHCDFTWNSKHINMLSYDDFKDNVILCTSPSKSFNLAGLQVSNIFIPNEEIRNRFQTELWNTGYSLINIMGLVACKSAYDNGKEWLDEVREYLLENINLVDSFLKEKMPKVKLIYPEGTYLLWLDFNELGLSDEKLNEVMLNDAKLWLDSGSMFGETGRGFQRLNIAMPRAKLQEALDKMEEAFRKYCDE